MTPLDLAEESANLEEQERVKRNLQAVLTGSLYENRLEEIWEYVKGKGKWGRRELYTGALHRFGRKD